MRFIPHGYNHHAQINIFTFPYAGGGLHCYRELLMPLEQANIISLELPGRQRLINVPPFKSMPRLVDSLVQQIKPLLDRSYIFYGHSMGGWIAYDLLCQLQAQQLPLPTALIVSASRAPDCTYDNLSQLKNTNDLYHWLTEIQFPFIDTGLLKLLKPTLLADFEMIATRIHYDHPPLPVPFNIIYGTTDPIATKSQVLTWQNFTSKDCHFHQVVGGHFFIYENLSLFSNLIGEILTSIPITSLPSNQSDYNVYTLRNLTP